MKIEWKSCFRIGISIFLLYLCINYWTVAANLFSLLLGAAMPLFIGCIIAYVANILMSFYEKHYFTKTKYTWLHKSRRPACMVLAFASVIAVAFLIVRLILPQLFDCVQLILAELPEFLTFVFDSIEEMNILPEDIAGTLANFDWQSKIGEIIQMLTSGLGNIVDVIIRMVSSVFSVVVSGLLSIIFAIYLLLGKETLNRQVHKILARYMKKNWYDNFNYVIAVVDDCFHKYIVGQCIEAVIIGVLCTVGMSLLQLPYATMVGALIAFTALIPVAGAYIGAFVGAFMILTVSPIKALIFLIFIVVLQQLEGNIIYPKVVGSSMGLPGIWVLAAVTIGGGVMGITGMLLGVPLVAAIYRLLREDVNKEH